MKLYTICQRCHGSRWVLRKDTPLECPKCHGGGVLTIKAKPRRAETHFEELDPRDFALTRSDILRART
jgi:DnaJ-class molecular chaperone